MLVGMPAFAVDSGPDAPARAGTLTIGADADPIGLDPATITAFSSFDFTALIYTGLLRWNAEMKIEPDLAVELRAAGRDHLCLQASPGSEVPQRPGLHRRGRQVHLRPHPRTRQPRSRLRALYSGIKAVTVIDPFTVKFELKTTDAAFLSYLATNPDGAIVPKGVANLNTQPVGTGPFIFEAYQPNQQFSLTANPNYYEKGLPRLSKVVFKFYKDQATLIVGAAFQARST